LPISIAIIGAGPLGRSLALRAARAGLRVFLEDVLPSHLHHAQEYIRQELNAEALPSVTFASTVEDAVRVADLIIDCVPDELESKLEILWLLDRMAPPHAVFATPTTRLSIADLASCTYRPAQCVAIAAEPSALAQATEPRVEIRTTSSTAPETIALLDRFWCALGFSPQFRAEP
jgi:3-hydroxybutyryl-CoA dehydrogenase